MGFLIVTDSRKRDEILFMVDRRKQKKSFWSSRLDDAFIYQLRSEAEEKARSYKFNNARVVSLSEAHRFLDAEDRERDHLAALDADEVGWDAHKSWA